MITLLTGARSAIAIETIGTNILSGVRAGDRFFSKTRACPPSERRTRGRAAVRPRLADCYPQAASRDGISITVAGFGASVVEGTASTGASGSGDGGEVTASTLAPRTARVLHTRRASFHTSRCAGSAASTLSTIRSSLLTWRSAVASSASTGRVAARATGRLRQLGRRPTVAGATCVDAVPRAGPTRVAADHRLHRAFAAAFEKVRIGCAAQDG